MVAFKIGDRVRDSRGEMGVVVSLYLWLREMLVLFDCGKYGNYYENGFESGLSPYYAQDKVTVCECEFHEGDKVSSEAFGEGLVKQVSLLEELKVVVQFSDGSERVFRANGDFGHSRLLCRITPKTCSRPPAAKYPRGIPFPTASCGPQ